MNVLSIEQQHEYFQMAMRMEYEGDYESAQELYGLVMASAFELEDFSLYIETALRTMSIDVIVRNYDDAFILTEIIREYMEEYASSEQKIIFENIRLSVNHHLNMENVIPAYERLLQRAYEIESLQQIINVGNNLMDCYVAKGYAEDAIVLLESMRVYVEDEQSMDYTLEAYTFWLNYFSLYVEYENVEKMLEALQQIEALHVSERLPRLVYKYWAAKANYALLTDCYSTAKFYFEKAIQSVGNKEHTIHILEQWLQLLKEKNYATDLIYFQQLLIEALSLKVKDEDNVHKARIASQISKSALERKLHTDRLTGVKNRTFYEDQLDKKWHVSYYTLAIFDIDRFKIVNDTYGHLVGDQAIKWLASIANTWKPFKDIDIVRYGGDEFIIMAPHPIESMHYHLEKLRQYVMNQYFLIRETGESIHLTISMGVCYTAEATALVEDLFKVADKALYEAKETGRNRIYEYAYKEETSKL